MFIRCVYGHLINWEPSVATTRCVLKSPVAEVMLSYWRADASKDELISRERMFRDTN